MCVSSYHTVYLQLTQRYTSIISHCGWENEEKSIIRKQWMSARPEVQKVAGEPVIAWTGWTWPSWRRPVRVTIVTDKTDDSAFAVIWGTTKVLLKNKRVTTNNILTPKWNKIWIVPWDQNTEGSCQSRKYCLRVISHHYHFTVNLFPNWAREHVYELKWDSCFYINWMKRWEAIGENLWTIKSTGLCATFGFYDLLFRKALVHVIIERHTSKKCISHRSIISYLTTQIWEQRPWLN